MRLLSGLKLKLVKRRFIMAKLQKIFDKIEKESYKKRVC